METMKKLFSYLMALTAVLTLASCSSKDDGPRPRSLTSVEYVTGRKMFTSQTSDIEMNGGPMGKLKPMQDATLSFTSSKDFSFSNKLKVKAMEVDFEITVNFSGTYTTLADGTLSLQGKGDTFKTDIKHSAFPLLLAPFQGKAESGIKSALGVTAEKLNASAIACKINQARHKLTLTYPADWKTPMTNVFVWTATADQ